MPGPLGGLMEGLQAGWGMADKLKSEELAQRMKAMQMAMSQRHMALQELQAENEANYRQDMLKATLGRDANTAENQRRDDADRVARESVAELEKGYDTLPHRDQDPVASEDFRAALPKLKESERQYALTGKETYANVSGSTVDPSSRMPSRTWHQLSGAMEAMPGPFGAMVGGSGNELTADPSRQRWRGQAEGALARMTEASKALTDKESESKATAREAAIARGEAELAEKKRHNQEAEGIANKRLEQARALAINMRSQLVPSETEHISGVKQNLLGYDLMLDEARKYMPGVPKDMIGKALSYINEQDPRYTRLKAILGYDRVMSLFQTTGKQSNEQERAWMKDYQPQPNDSLDQIAAKVSGLRDVQMRIFAARLGAYQANGKNVDRFIVENPDVTKVDSKLAPGRHMERWKGASDEELQAPAPGDASPATIQRITPQPAPGERSGPAPTGAPTVPIKSGINLDERELPPPPGEPMKRSAKSPSLPSPAKMVTPGKVVPPAPPDPITAKGEALIGAVKEPDWKGMKAPNIQLPQGLKAEPVKGEEDPGMDALMKVMADTLAKSKAQDKKAAGPKGKGKTPLPKSAVPVE